MRKPRSQLNQSHAPPTIGRHSNQSDPIWNRMVITLNRFNGLKLEFQQDLPAIKTHELVDGEVMATRQTDCIEPVHQLIYLNQSPANDQAYSRSIKIEMEGAPSLNVMPHTDHLKIEPHLQIPPQTFGAQQTLEVNYQPPMTDLDCRWRSASYDRPSNWLTNSKGQVDRQRQDNSATFYNYHQTNFTPTAGFCDTRRQSDKFNVGDASFLEQHQNFHYNTASSQLVYSGYGRDDCKHVARVNQQGFGPTSISHNHHHHHHHHSLEGQHYSNDHSQITYQNQNFNLHEPKNNWPVMVNLPASHRQQTTDPAPSYWCAHSQYCYEHGQSAFNQNSELDFYQAHDWTERDTFHSKPLQNVGADYYSSGYSQTGCTLQVDNRQSASNADYPQIDSKPNLNETSGNVLTEKQDLDASKYGSQQTNQSGEERLSSQHSSTNDNESKDENSNQETVTEQNSPPSKAERLNRSNECITCGKYYARPSTLKTHQRTHTNERPYKCNACLKTFSQAANLTAHQRVHTGERPFPCPICGRQFSQSSSVITHLRTHSGERPYRCEKCSRTFSDSSTLTKHCRVHSGEKPYHCGFCSMQFSQSGNLSRHLRLHSTTASPNKTNQSPAIPDSNTSKTTASTTAMSIKQHNHSSHSPVSPGSTMSSYSLSSSVSSSISLSHSGSTSSS